MAAGNVKPPEEKPPFFETYIWSSPSSGFSISNLLGISALGDVGVVLCTVVTTCSDAWSPSRNSEVQAELPCRVSRVGSAVRSRIRLW